MYLGSLWLGPRTLPWFIVFAVVGVRSWSPCSRRRWPGPSGWSITFVLALLILVASFRRSRLGIAGPKGESMLVDLRDRIIRQGEIAALPAHWYARSVLRSAGGTAFAGDFIVANTTDVGSDARSCVDVSGKGVEAGTRSLLLSGAFGGLLSALPAEKFLPAANDFLVRQDWDEGFATAIHLHLDLDTGRLRAPQGRAPAGRVDALGSGRWEILDSEGRGARPDARRRVRAACAGRWRRATADALHRRSGGGPAPRHRQRDRQARRSWPAAAADGFEGGEVTLIDELERVDDDRALLVHRRPS